MLFHIYSVLKSSQCYTYTLFDCCERCLNDGLDYQNYPEKNTLSKKEIWFIFTYSDNNLM